MSEKSEEQTNESDVKVEAEGTAEAKAEGSGNDGKIFGLNKFIVFGGAGFLVLALSIVAVMLLTGGEKAKVTDDPEAKHETVVAEQPEKVEKDSHAAADTHDEAVEEVSFEDKIASGDIDFDEPDFVIDENDPNVLDQITSSLEFLDYDPNEFETGEEEEVNEPEMSKEDSVEAVNWLDAEKAKLAEKETRLDKKEKELQTLDRDINRKMLILEQAESTRIAKLAKLYDGMDARSVTKLMANLDDATVVSIISRMKQKNASLVLQMISPKRAARLSKKMLTIAEN